VLTTTAWIVVSAITYSRHGAHAQMFCFPVHVSYAVPAVHALLHKVLCAHWMCWCPVQVLLACFIVPAWLAGIRELLQQRQLGQAAALAVGGLAVLLVLDAVNKRAAAARAATAAATVTAGTVRRCLPSGGS
jgi:hypothetical protein